MFHLTGAAFNSWKVCKSYLPHSALTIAVVVAYNLSYLDLPHTSPPDLKWILMVAANRIVFVNETL